MSAGEVMTEPKYVVCDDGMWPHPEADSCRNPCVVAVTMREVQQTRAAEGRSESQHLMEGYTRTNSMTIALAEALADALYANPNQRLGQLLINLNSRRDDIVDAHNRMWDCHDEEWIRLLNDATEGRA